MDRPKAVIASAAVAGSLVTGGLAFALSGGALTPRQDNVGKLQPTTSVAAPIADARTSVGAAPAATAPRAIEAAPATAPPATVSKASPATSAEHEDGEHEHEEHEHEYEDGDDD